MATTTKSSIRVKALCFIYSMGTVSIILFVAVLQGSSIQVCKLIIYGLLTVALKLTCPNTKAVVGCFMASDVASYGFLLSDKIELEAMWALIFAAEYIFNGYIYLHSYVPIMTLSPKLHFITSAEMYFSVCA